MRHQSSTNSTKNAIKAGSNIGGLPPGHVPPKQHNSTKTTIKAGSNIGDLLPGHRPPKQSFNRYKTPRPGKDNKRETIPAETATGAFVDCIFAIFTYRVLATKVTQTRPKITIRTVSNIRDLLTGRVSPKQPKLDQNRD